MMLFLKLNDFFLMTKKIKGYLSAIFYFNFRSFYLYSFFCDKSFLFYFMIVVVYFIYSSFDCSLKFAQIENASYIVSSIIRWFWFSDIILVPWMSKFTVHTSVVHATFYYYVAWVANYLLMKVV